MTVRGSMTSAEMLALFELVHRPAIRALRGPSGSHIQVHLGMAVPDLHVGLGAGAEDAAVAVQVLGQQFDDGLRARGGRAHVQTLVSQWAYLGLRPFTMSKN